MSSTELPPTHKQLRYLRTLAGRAGQTFVTPLTRADASDEIRRLKAVRSTGFTFAELQAEQAAREAHGDVAIIQPREIAGHGSQRDLAVKAEPLLAGPSWKRRGTSNPRIGGLSASVPTDASGQRSGSGRRRSLAWHSDCRAEGRRIGEAIAPDGCRRSAARLSEAIVQVRPSAEDPACGVGTATHVRRRRPRSAPHTDRMTCSLRRRSLPAASDAAWGSHQTSRFLSQ